MNLFSIEFQQPTDYCITINYPLSTVNCDKLFLLTAVGQARCLSHSGSNSIAQPYGGQCPPYYSSMVLFGDPEGIRFAARSRIRFAARVWFVLKLYYCQLKNINVKSYLSQALLKKSLATNR